MLRKFKRRLNDQCTLSEEELTEKVVIDMELPFAAITEHFIEELEYMEPFGKVIQNRFLRQRHRHAACEDYREK